MVNDIVRGADDVRAFAQMEEVLQRIASKGIRPGLERITRLLGLVGDPQNEWPAFHVVGTNGKGSTCAFLASVLNESGYRTAFYSSPHLENPGERLLVKGEQLSGAAWLEAVRKIESIVADDGVLATDPPSYFELVTAAAFMLAREEGAEAGVIEAGLGGRLDATNTLGRTVCSVIASISMDHTDYLGDTLDKIAGEKFAVVKMGVPACFMGDNASLIPQFREECARRGAVPFIASEEVSLDNVSVTEAGCSFDFASPHMRLSGVKTRLTGRYQLSNASLALCALSHVREAFPRITDESILRGMAAASWPGRLEILGGDPLTVLDGGHNRDGVEKLVQSAAELWPGRRIGVVYAAMRDKEYKECLSLLNRLAPSFYATEVPGMARCLPCGELLNAAAAMQWRNEPAAFASPLSAWEAASRENDIVLVCGSLYMIGWIRPLLRGRLS